MIYQREHVRQAVQSAMQLDAIKDESAAVAAVAKALSLPVESVRECLAGEKKAA